MLKLVAGAEVRIAHCFTRRIIFLVLVILNPCTNTRITYFRITYCTPMVLLSEDPILCLVPGVRTHQLDCNTLPLGPWADSVF